MPKLASRSRRGVVGLISCAALIVLAPEARSASLRDKDGSWNPHRIVPVVEGEILPTLTELEARGATIGDILVRVDDVFDPEQESEDNWLYRAANALHHKTHHSTILEQLTFHEGEPLIVQRVEESERALRSRRYLFDAVIRVARYEPSRNVADLEIVVRDVWTLEPGVNYSNTGGKGKTEFQIEELNLFGSGQKLQLAYEKNVDRSSAEVEWVNHSLFGTHWELATRYADLSDGQTGFLQIERPFYSLDSRWAFGVTGYRDDRVTTRYDLGRPVDSFGVETDQFEVSLGWSSGLREGWARRWRAGLAFEQKSFATAEGYPAPASLPGDRKFIYPWVGAEWVEDAYQKVRNHDRIGRTEDIYRGTRWTGRLGYASRSLGSDEPAWLFSSGLSSGRQYKPNLQWELDATARGRIKNASLRDAILNLEARHYWKIDSRQTFFARIGAALTEKLDADSQLFMGAEEGLRGYPLRYQTGTSRALLTLEHRYYTDWYPFRLFHVGAAAFFDAGRTWGPTTGGQQQVGWRKDIGLGLRFGNSRSGLGSVLHLDLAYALDPIPGRGRFRVSIETKQGF